MNGSDLAVKLRKKFPLANIAMVTANVQDAVRKRAEEVGAEFIGKPITEDEIMRFFQMESANA